MLLTIYTQRYRYLVRREQINTIYALAVGPVINTAKPSVFRDLGPLLLGADEPTEGRCHVVQVALRRRNVSFLVVRVDDLQTNSEAQVRPLDPLIARNLQRQWVTGTLIDHDELLLVLDLERIARDVLLGGS
jgi:chemotaxis signal transduction protein